MRLLSKVIYAVIRQKCRSHEAPYLYVFLQSFGEVILPEYVFLCLCCRTLAQDVGDLRTSCAATEETPASNITSMRAFYLRPWQQTARLCSLRIIPFQHHNPQPKYSNKKN
jgi:hypothetical protein